MKALKKAREALDRPRAQVLRPHGDLADTLRDVLIRHKHVVCRTIPAAEQGPSPDELSDPVRSSAGQSMRSHLPNGHRARSLQGSPPDWRAPMPPRLESTAPRCAPGSTRRRPAAHDPRPAWVVARRPASSDACIAVGPGIPARRLAVHWIRTIKKLRIAGGWCAGSRRSGARLS